MTTSENRPDFCPRKAWSTSIDEVVLNIKMKKLDIKEKKLLKELREEREYLTRWRKAQKLKKEKEYLLERREKIRRRLADEDAEEMRRAEARRRGRAAQVDQLKTSSHHEEKKRTKSPENCSKSRMRSMDRSRTEGDMNVPTRAAPPPPSSNSSWSSSIFGPRDKSLTQKTHLPKKKPPPRPPPPKFSQSRSTDLKGSQLVPGLFPRSQSRLIHEPVASLIDWSSPPSSPTSTTRSSSDALSVHSFGSDSITPSSGSNSNVESGFEDDFDLYGAPNSRSADPWSPPLPVAKAPVKTPWVTFSPSVPKKHIMPTIIRGKPQRPKVPKILEKKIEMDTLAEVFQNTRLVNNRPGTVDDDDDGWSSDSPPMPTCPPPAPPPELLADLLAQSVHSESRNESQISGHGTAVALFDYNGAPGDLSFREGDCLRIIRHIDEHWVEAALGHCKGTAPTNHLKIEGSDNRLVTALHAFPAETWEDLALQPGAQLRLLGRINADWLYGEFDGKRGQFPANFVDNVPSDLPLWLA